MITAIALTVGVYRYGGEKRLMQLLVLAIAFLSIRTIGTTHDFAHANYSPVTGSLLLGVIVFIGFCGWRIVSKTYALLLFIPVVQAVYVLGYNLTHRDSGLSLCCGPWVY
jgi:hypothetical protein